jgi:hypothetical protein
VVGQPSDCRPHREEQESETWQALAFAPVLSREWWTVSFGAWPNATAAFSLLSFLIFAKATALFSQSLENCCPALEKIKGSHRSFLGFVVAPFLRRHVVIA